MRSLLFAFVLLPAFLAGAQEIYVVDEYPEPTGGMPTWKRNALEAREAHVIYAPRPRRVVEIERRAPNPLDRSTAGDPTWKRRAKESSSTPAAGGSLSNSDTATVIRIHE